MPEDSPWHEGSIASNGNVTLEHDSTRGIRSDRGRWARLTKMSPESIDTLPANKSIGCLGNAPRNSLSFLCRPLAKSIRLIWSWRNPLIFDGSLPCFVFPSSSLLPILSIPPPNFHRAMENLNSSERKLHRSKGRRGAKKACPRWFSSHKREDANREMQNERRTKGISRAIEGCRFTKVALPSFNFRPRSWTYRTLR